jgi:hypothetical protein
MEKGVGRSTRRVLPWNEEITEYLEGTSEETGVHHVDLPRILGFHKKCFPFPRDFTKFVFKNVFQQRYRDVVGHAISPRETC